MKEIIKFQLVFLKALEDACMLESFETLESPTAFKVSFLKKTGICPSIVPFSSLDKKFN